MEKQFEVWRNKTQVVLISLDHPQRKQLIENKIKIHSFVAKSYNDAMIKYHKLMGWLEYVPSENPDEDKEFEDI